MEDDPASIPLYSGHSSLWYFLRITEKQEVHQSQNWQSLQQYLATWQLEQLDILPIWKQYEQMDLPVSYSGAQEYG